MKTVYICSVCGKELVENGYINLEQWWLEHPKFPHKNNKDREVCRKKWEKIRVAGSRYSYSALLKKVTEKKKQDGPVRSRHLVRYVG